MSSSTEPPRAETEDVPALPQPRSLDSIILELRQLALAALDAGQPMAAVLIAGTADRLEAGSSPPQPARPSYP
jgi:hypothetical protein